MLVNSYSNTEIWIYKITDKKHVEHKCVVFLGLSTRQNFDKLKTQLNIIIEKGFKS